MRCQPEPDRLLKLANAHRVAQRVQCRFYGQPSHPSGTFVIPTLELKRFRWNVLTGAEVSDLIVWLRSGTFPEAVDTATLVAGVSFGRYGTSDPKIIQPSSVFSPFHRRSAD